jgi:hypothetical protein
MDSCELLDLAGDLNEIHVHWCTAQDM